MASVSNAVPSGPAVPDDVNGLVPQVWPESAHRDEAGRLVLAGLDAASLVARFGTPLYVVDEAEARGRARRTRAAFETAPERNAFPA